MSKNCVFLSVMIRLLAVYTKGSWHGKTLVNKADKTRLHAGGETRLFMLVSLADIFFKAYLWFNNI